MSKANPVLCGVGSGSMVIYGADEPIACVRNPCAEEHKYGPKDTT